MFWIIRDVKGIKARPWATVFIGVAVLVYASMRHAIDCVALAALMSSCLASVGEAYEF